MVALYSLSSFAQSATEFKPMQSLRTPSSRCQLSPLYFVEGTKMIPVEKNMIVEPARPMDVPGCYTIARKDFTHLPYTNIDDMVSMLPGVYQKRRGDDLRIYGSR